MLILRRNTRINKNFIFVILIIFLLSRINAIRINEVEINPAEGKEWVELYNEDSEKINITNWEIWEGVSGSSGPKKIKSFSNETILEAGEFYIIEFSNKLNNEDGDFVILYNNFHNKIDETLILKEKKGSDKTYQFCDGKFIFREATKGEKNKCEEQNLSNNQTKANTTKDEEDKEEIEKNEKPKSSNKLTGLSAGSSQNNHQKNVTLEPIILNSKNIKSKDDTKFSTEKLAFAGVVIFGVVFGALFFLKKRKYKNEFR